MTRDDAEQVMKRCQVGTRNYEEANNLHAECFRIIGKLLSERTEQEPVVGTKTWFEDGKVVTQNLYYSDVYTTPPQRTESDDIASIIACRDMLDAQPVPPRRIEGKNT
jgi:hypothetical protein